MWRRGVEEAWNALEEMHRRGETTDRRTLSRMLVRSVDVARGAQLDRGLAYRGLALTEAFVDRLPQDVDEVLFNVMLDTCCRLGDLGRLEAVLARMRALGVTPSAVTLGIRVKAYGQNRMVERVLQVWDEMGAQRAEANVVTYCCMIEACVKCRRLDKALQLFREMRSSGHHRNTILYCTLIKGHGCEKDLASALELFREMPEEGVPYNTVAYNSILDVCIKCGELAMAEGLLREMSAPQSLVKPDLITFSTLLKGYCTRGDIERAVQVLEAIKLRGLRCDELVYNMLINACVKARDIMVGMGLFEEMLRDGIQPSSITHGILEQLYCAAGYEDTAPEAVARLYADHGIEPEGSASQRDGASARRGAPARRPGRRTGRSHPPKPSAAVAPREPSAALDCQPGGVASAPALGSIGHSAGSAVGWASCGEWPQSRSVAHPGCSQRAPQQNEAQLGPGMGVLPVAVGVLPQAATLPVPFSGFPGVSAVCGALMPAVQGLPLPGMAGDDGEAGGCFGVVAAWPAQTVGGPVCVWRRRLP